jgi:hypothetical protein
MEFTCYPECALNLLIKLSAANLAGHVTYLEAALALRAGNGIETFHSEVQYRLRRRGQ